MWGWIKRFFIGLFRGSARVFMELVADAYPAVKAEILGKLTPYAKGVVKELTFENMRGAEKREIAFKKIVEYAKEVGQKFEDQWIYDLIETALGAIRIGSQPEE